MKQKLLMLLAVLLTGGMLVACGPGDDSAEGTAGGGAGVVDEPFGDTTGAEGDAGGDLDAEGTADAGGTTEAEGETVEMELGGDNAATEDRAADGTETELDQTEDTAAAGEGEDAAAEGEEGDVAGGGAAAPASSEPVVITLSQAAEGVAVENIQGAEDAQSIASTGESNPSLNLTVGQRYEFVYDGEGDLVFFDSDNQPLLSTAGTDGAFAEDADVSAETQDGRISFTVTEELAQELDHYAAGPDEQGGSINAN